MQTPNLPIQINANPAPAKNGPRPNQNSGGDAQFSAALSREVSQRQQGAAPQTAPTKPNGPAKPAQAQQADKPAAAKPAEADSTTPSSAGPKDAAAESVESQPEVAADGNSALDMAALMASLNLPGAATPAPVAATVLPGASAASAVETNPALTGAAVLAPGAGAGKNMMAKLDGSALDGVKPQVSDEGNPLGQPVERLVSDAKPVAAKIEAATGQPKGLADAAQFSAILRNREAAPEAAGIKDLAVTGPAAAPVQQASLALAQAAIGVATDKIAARVGSDGWDQQVGQKVIWMVAGKEQSASLTLNPPDMGPMQVVLSVNNDQATVTFSAAQPEVRQALEDALPKLREMMSESGIALGNASVNDGAAQQQAQADAREAGRSGGRNGGTGGVSSSGETTVAPAPRRGGGQQGLVDTFA
ncbi:flagellar hook-length control protein FliK [Massilia sp. CF038]|uniref:flagellar hook-length control protein FliK n=1 Tax=Massilia sp. CF038 TaxID=1881045 RepID=UPI0009184875|nr:flagellar hook-length control protein FliK [Massilia sp. CF038]SHG44647.1 flagellar hook-length control protein FliK [Massilia sp. CF038]